MKLPTLVLGLMCVSAGLLRASEGCAACEAGEKAAKPTAAVANDAGAARYPLRGVVVDVMAEQSALLVKHEEIPGVMRAMTMLLKVDAAGLAAAKKGDPVAGQLVRKTDGWWLEDVKLAKSS